MTGVSKENPLAESGDIDKISQQLREWVHSASDSIFVARGFVEELAQEIRAKDYLKEDFDHESFSRMAEGLLRNIEKIDRNLHNLRRFAKQDIFKAKGDTPHSSEKDET